MTPSELGAWAKECESDAKQALEHAHYFQKFDASKNAEQAKEWAAESEQRAAELRRWARILPLVEAVLRDEDDDDFWDTFKALRAAVSEPGEKP